MSDEYTVHTVSVDPIDRIGDTVDVHYHGDHDSLSMIAGTLATVNQIGVGVIITSLGQHNQQFFPWTSVVRLILT